MNIFALDMDPKLAARAHFDKHVVKMVVETAQLLSTAWRETTVVGARYSIPAEAYKSTHRNHPCARWARQTAGNYLWLAALGKELCLEYTRRYGRVHKTEAVMDALRQVPHSMRSLPTWVTPFALAMPEEFHPTWPAGKLPTQQEVIERHVGAYRDYYLTDKAHLLAYRNCEPPAWVLLEQAADAGLLRK